MGGTKCPPTWSPSSLWMRCWRQELQWRRRGFPRGLGHAGEGGGEWHCSPQGYNVNSHHLEQDILDSLWTSCSFLHSSAVPKPGPGPHSSCCNPLGSTAKRSSGGLASTPVPPKRPKAAGRGSSRSTGPALGPSYPVPHIAPTASTVLLQGRGSASLCRSGPSEKAAIPDSRQVWGQVSAES